MSEQEFNDWLKDQMRIRGWRLMDLARAANVAPSSVTRVVSEGKPPGPDVCTALAHALDIPPALVFRKAGLLPEMPDETQQLAPELIAVFTSLSEADQKQVVDYILFLNYQRSASVPDCTEVDAHNPSTHKE